MTDTAPLASIAADLSGGRTSGLRFLDGEGTLAIVLDVTGLAADDRGPLEDKLRAGPLAPPGGNAVGGAVAAANNAVTMSGVGRGHAGGRSEEDRGGKAGGGTGK